MEIYSEEEFEEIFFTSTIIINQLKIKTTKTKKIQHSLGVKEKKTA